MEEGESVGGVVREGDEGEEIGEGSDREGNGEDVEIEVFEFGVGEVPGF